MGYHYKDKNFEVPKQVCWMVLKPGVDGEGTFQNLDPESDCNARLRIIVKGHDFVARKNVEYMENIRSFEWGDQHGVMLDRYGRVFTTGRTINGLLGLSEEETDEIICDP